MRKSSSLPVLSMSCSGAENASVHTHALSSAAHCEPGGDSRGKDAAFSQACAPGLRCSRNPSSCSELSQKRAGASGLHCCLGACACTRCKAPSHHRHKLKGRLANSTKTASPQTSLKSFILQGKEKVERQTT